MQKQLPPKLLLMIGLALLFSACEPGAELEREIPELPADTDDDTQSTDTVDSDPDAVTCPGLYTLVDLGTLGGNETVAYEFSNTGWVVGVSEIEPGPTNNAPFIREPDADNAGTGTMIHFADTGIEGLTPNNLIDVNDHGGIVGLAWFQPDPVSGYEQAGFYWSEETGTIPIGDSVGYIPSGINNLGVTIGTAPGSGLQEGDSPVFVWTEQDGVVLLPEQSGPEPFNPAKAHDINDLGVVAGYGWPPHGSIRAFSWHPDSGYQILPDFGYGSSAVGINSHGHIVGYAFNEDETIGPYGNRPVMWKQPIGMLIDIGLFTTPEGLIRGKAAAINDDGFVVGTDLIDTGGSSEYKPWVWCGEGTEKQPLSELLSPAQAEVWELIFAEDINNEGAILVRAMNGDHTRAALMIPTP